MSLPRADVRFLLGALLATLVVPGLLLLWRPEQALGYGAGWGTALVLMVPSYLVLARGARDKHPQALVRSLLLGSLGRLVAMCAAIVAFRLLVADAPMGAFLLAFGLGYLLLTTLELKLVLPQIAKERAT